MHAFAAAAETASYGAGAYLVVFALMALSFAGIPAIGGAVVGWAAVLASQGKLNISRCWSWRCWVPRPAAWPVTPSVRGQVLPAPQGPQIAGERHYSAVTHSVPVSWRKARTAAPTVGKK